MIPSLRQGLSDIMEAAFVIYSSTSDPEIVRRAEYIRQLADTLKVYADELDAYDQERWERMEREEAGA